MNTQNSVSKQSGKWLRKWATPLTILSFLVSALTGLLIFFDFKTHPVKVIHEWGSIIFVVASLLHLVVHQRAMISHLKKTWVWAPLTLLTLVIVAFAMFGPRGRHHGRQGEDVVSQAPIQLEP